MALYLNEVWLNEPNPSSFREFVEVFGKLRGETQSLGLSSDFRLVSGPWLSVEEAKVVYVFEVDDVSATLQPFGRLLAKGLLKRRRLTPVADWDAAKRFVSGL
jgi:hypothetical protein